MRETVSRIVNFTGKSVQNEEFITSENMEPVMLKIHQLLNSVAVRACSVGSVRISAPAAIIGKYSNLLSLVSEW